MIHAHQLLGGVVDPAQAWFCRWNDSAWHEIGDGSWRVSFVPAAAGKIVVQAHLKNRMGSSGNSRLYCKARVVQLTPFYRSDFSLYSEAMWEGTPGYGDQVRFLDSPITPFIVVDVQPEHVGHEHMYSVDYMAGDGISGQVGYGSPLVIIG